MQLRSYAHIRTHHLRHRKERFGIETDRKIADDIPSCLDSFVAPAHRLSARGEADMIIQRARLGYGSHVECADIAIKDGWIVAVGKSSAGWSGHSTRRIDAAGCSVLPGFTDGHVHLPVGAEQQAGGNLGKTDSQEALRALIRRYAIDHASDPVLYFYDLHYFDPPLIPPDNARHFLDELVSNKPLFIYAHDLHTGWANSKALEEASLLHRMPPFPHELDILHLEQNLLLGKDGLPGGELKEPPAYFLVEARLRKRYPATAKQKLEALRAAIAYLAGLGLTSIHSMGLDLPEEDMELMLLLLELEQRQELNIRVNTSFSIVPDEHMFHDLRKAVDIRDRLHAARRQSLSMDVLHAYLLDSMQAGNALRAEPQHQLRLRHPEAVNHPSFNAHKILTDELHEMIHILHVQPHLDRLEERLASCEGTRLDPYGRVYFNTVKLFMDGVVEKNTAFRLDQNPAHGIPVFSREDLGLLVRTADRAGLQVAVHSIGDGSVRAVLDAVAEARRENATITNERGHTIRHRIEHIEMCRANDLARFAQLEVVASMQSLHEREPTTLWHQLVPSDQWGTAFAWKSLIDTGARLVFGSDWPIVSCNCLLGMEHAVTRRRWKPDLPDESLSIEQAADAFTRHAAYVERNENIKGVVREGMQADLVIVNGSIEDLPEKGHDNILVMQTICGGKTTFCRGS